MPRPNKAKAKRLLKALRDLCITERVSIGNADGFITFFGSREDEIVLEFSSLSDEGKVEEW